MKQSRAYLAVDLGAESGRVIKGVLEDGILRLEPIARFPNGMVPIHGHFHWNFIRLYEEMLQAFKQCSRSDPPIESVGVDSWGVDFVLLAEDQTLLGLPVAYRDGRTEGMMEKMFQKIPAEKIYEKTGIQFMVFNSLFQLLALSEQNSAALQHAAHFLMVPDYFHYLFTGKITNEYTEATTSQCLNVHTRTWDPQLLRAAGVCPSLMKEVIQPGTIIGTITPQLQQMTGLGPIPVVAPGTHDTASAVAAVPAEGDRWAYISSGTWSLMGIETTAPAGSPKAFEYNFTNEGGVCGTIRFLKNIMGMWMVQRCRAAFDKELDYNELTRMAAEAPAFVSLIDPEWDAFLNPPSMTEAIADFCRKTGQPVPANEGAYIRCCLESLAMQYRLVMQQICQICNKTFDTLHIVGGGSRNQLLNQLTADATATSVKTGPVEATVIGNLIMQAIGLGHIDSLKEARQIIGRSFEMETYTPKDPGRWDNGFERFLRLKKIKN